MSGLVTLLLAVPLLGVAAYAYVVTNTFSNPGHLLGADLATALLVAVAVLGVGLIVQLYSWATTMQQEGF